jgi:hypothetical protein
MPSTIKDAIKMFEERKQCVAAEAEKVRERGWSGRIVASRVCMLHTMHAPACRWS